MKHFDPFMRLEEAKKDLRDVEEILRLLHKVGFEIGRLERNVNSHNANEHVAGAILDLRRYANSIDTSWRF